MAWLTKSKARAPVVNGRSVLMGFSPWDRGRISADDAYLLDTFSIEIKSDSGHIYTLKLTRAEAERFAGLVRQSSKEST